MNRSRITGDLVSQNNIFVDIANDRVGIGSTIPGQKLSLPDSAKIALGNSADLQIFHDGTHSRINAVNTGFLAISSGADALTLSAANRIDISDDFIRLRSRDGSDVYMTGTVNAAVDLYHNGTKKFETTAYGIDVTGTTGTDGLVVSGVTTSGNITVSSTEPTLFLTDTDHNPDYKIHNLNGQFRITDATAGAHRLVIHSSGNFDVSGQANIQSGLNVSGGDLTLTGGDLTITDTNTDSAAGPEFKLFRNSASPADADYLGQIKFAGESDTGVERNYAKITGKILDASNGTEDGILEFAHIKAGSQVITGRFRSDSLQLLNGTQLTVAGTTTLNSPVTINTSTSEQLILSGASNPYIQFQEGTTNKAYIQWSAGSGYLQIGNEEAGEVLRLADGETGLIWRVGTSNRTVWTSGNDGTGSGLDADTVDGLQASQFLRSDANDSTSGSITFSNDSTGINLYGGGRFYKQGGSGLFVRLPSGGQQLQVENNSGTTLGTFWHSGNDGSGTGLDADLLDGVQGSSFLRSDANDTASGQISLTYGSAYPFDINGANDAKIVLRGSSNPYIRFREADADKAYIQWNSNGNLYFVNQESGEQVYIGSGTNGLKFVHNGTTSTVWHAGNDGTGTGLDADTLDGVQGSSFLRSDADDTLTGDLTLNGRLIANEGSPPATGPNHFISDDGSTTTLGTAATLRVANNGGNAAYSVLEAESGSGSIRLANDGQFYVTGNTTFSNRVRVDINSNVDGFMGEAYQGYFGLKHTDQTMNTEYMILSQNTHTFISATSGNSVYIRGGGNSSTNQMIVSTSGTTIGGNTVLTTANEGSGNGLDADTLDGAQGSQFLRSDSADTCSGQITFTNSIVSSKNGNKSTQGGAALVLTHGTTTNLRMNFFIHDDFPSGSGTAYLQVTESGVSNARDFNLQGYGGNVMIGNANATPTEKLEVNGNVKASNFSGSGSLLTNIPANQLSSGTVAAARLPQQESGTSIVGNFGQWQGHNTYNNFNTEPAYWGWNYVMGNANAPNTASGQWYRCRLSLGSEYGKGSDSNDYSMEMAIPRTQSGTQGQMWLRPIENGSEQTWIEVGSRPYNSVIPRADNAIDLGSSSIRWANLYTADAHFNNIGTGGNEIDGTEGSWTLQEAEDNVYMINRKNGKRYKIKMEEV